MLYKGNKNYGYKTPMACTKYKYDSKLQFGDQRMCNDEKTNANKTSYMQI